jgi:hypothetical protein
MLVDEAAPPKKAAAKSKGPPPKGKTKNPSPEDLPF